LYFPLEFIFIIDVNGYLATLQRNDIMRFQCDLKLVASIKYHGWFKETQLGSYDDISLFILDFRFIEL